MPDFAISLLVRLFNSLNLFVISTIVARHLGSGGKGLIVETLFIPTLLVIVGFKWGMDTASLVVIRRFKELKDALLSGYVVIAALTTLVVLLLQQDFCVPMWESYFGPKFDLNLFYIALWMLPVQLLHDIFSNTILGCRNFRTFTYFKLVQPLLFFILMMGLWASEKFNWVDVPFDLFGQKTILMAYPVTFAVTVTVMFLFLCRHMPFTIKGLKPLFVKLFQLGFSVQIVAILLFLNRRADVAFITKMSLTKLNGVYSVVVTLIEIAWFVSKPLSSLVLDKATNDDKDGSAGRILRFTMFTSTVILVALTVLVPFYLSYLKDDFSQGFEPFLILIPGVLLFNCHQILSQIFYAKGEGNRLITLMVVGLMINVVLNFLWIDQYQLAGVATASTISYSFIGIGVLWMASKELNQSMFALLFPQKNDFKIVLGKFLKK